MDIKENFGNIKPIMWARLDVAKKLAVMVLRAIRLIVTGNDKTFNITEAHSLRL